MKNSATENFFGGQKGERGKDQIGVDEWSKILNCDRLMEAFFVKCNNYTLSHKIVSARENFWNVYCFTTNQM